jgi:hypothetical protein
VLEEAASFLERDDVPYTDRTKQLVWRLRYRLKQHGLTFEQYVEWKVDGCAICGEPFSKTPHIDHDHRHCAGKYGCKDCVRGLLCAKCNGIFIAVIENKPSLRQCVSSQVLRYIDKRRGPPPNQQN